MISFSDLGAQHREIAKEMRQAIDRVIERGDFILGEDVLLFEKEFARFCNSKFAVGVSSGTAGLFLALRALGIKEGDEVIVPDFTFIATALAVSYTGAKPVFVDIREDSYNIDPEKIRKVITKNTKAIIPVHLYGQPAEMPEIMKIAKENGLKVIEDACQAHGASFKMDGGWHQAGSVGDMGVFSFYPSKNMGGLGDGGLITASDETLHKKLLILRDCGRVSKYEHEVIGYNSRLDTLQAAVLRVKLKKIEEWNRMRASAAKLYEKYLGQVDGVAIPYAAPNVKHIYHCFAVRLKKREEVMARFKDAGVSAIIHYPIPLHLQKVYAPLGFKSGDFPVSEKVSQEILSLPMYPHIKESDIRIIADIIKEVS